MNRWSAYTIYLINAAAQALFFGIIFTYSIVYQTQLVGLSPLQLVLVGTCLEASVFLFEVPTGIVADIYSRRLSIIIGVFLIGVGFLVEGSFPSFAMILLAQVLWGLGYTFTSGATDAWIVDEVGEEAAGRVFLRGAQAGHIGALLGILIAIPLASVRVNLPVLTGGGLFIALAGFLALFMPEANFHPTPREERSTFQQMIHTFRLGLNLIQRRPLLWSILFIGLFFGLYSEGYDRLWTKYILDRFTLPSLGGLDPVAWFGLIRVGSTLLALGATELVRRKVDTTSSSVITRRLLLFSIVLVSSLLGFAWAPSFGVAVLLFWLVAVMRNVIDPLYTTWINQHLEPQVRATVLSMSGQVDAIGQVVGGPVVGWVGQVFSVRTAISLASVILAPVIVLFTRLLREK